MDSNRLIEFYEWDSKDGLEHIKKIPLFKISSVDMDNIINNNIKVSKDFLDKINNKTTLYRNKYNIKYGVLFCDLNKVVGVEFNKEGTIICRSSLLLDEEEDILDEVSVFEDYENIYVLADHVFVKENQVLYENDNSYLVSWCNDTVFLLKGNYVYAVGTNGTEYIRALHTSLNND